MTPAEMREKLDERRDDLEVVKLLYAIENDPVKRSRLRMTMLSLRKEITVLQSELISIKYDKLF